MSTGRDTAEIELSKRASYLSAFVGIVLLIAKFWAFHKTGSHAVLADAIESIVNVITALAAIAVMIISAKPADKDHPYGHGKVEFFSAAFEGGLIVFAAIMIVFEATEALLRGPTLQELNIGLLVLLLAGVGNLLLGIYLLWAGKKTRSIALVASGHHVLSDFYTTIGVGIGLWLVQLTGWLWLDPVCALVVGILLAATGVRLVRQSAGGLLDAEDSEILTSLHEIIASDDLPEGIIQVHHCRIMRSGSYHHIDAHAVVPEFWNVKEAHAETEAFEAHIMHKYPYQGELHLHVDPCRKAYCEVCSVGDCPIRAQKFIARHILTLDELVDPDEPQSFRG